MLDYVIIKKKQEEERKRRERENILELPLEDNLEEIPRDNPGKRDPTIINPTVIDYTISQNYFN